MRTEDGYIIQQCLDGNSAAFGFLVDKYKKSVYALAYSEIRNFHDAQDITQEVFIKAYQKLRTLKRWDNFMGWLYRITSNLCVDWLRSNFRRPDREFIEDQDTGILEHPAIDSYREATVYESIREALDSLPETYRQVLTLRYFGGMTVKEISRFLGTSPRTIDRRLREARGRLKEEILVMMSATYEQHQLPTSFTFRIVEIVKKIRIQPMPRATALPWGMSVAAGFLITVLSLSPHLNMLNIMGAPISSSLPGEARVLETGEIRVDILKASQLPVIANNQENSNLQPRELRNAFLMAPQAEGGTWTTKADMSTSRWGAVTCVVDGKIYAIGGGTTPSGKYFPTLEVYDPDMDTWTTKADMPTARNGHAVSVVNGRIYVIGGEPREKASIPTVEEYDPTTDTWTKKADMPTKRTFPSTAVVHGKIYAIGGVIAPGGSSTPAVEMYDPATDTWTTKANMPTARSMAAASTVDGKIYVIGGVIGSVGNSGISTVEEYDPATDIWTKKTNMPTGRKALSTSVVDRKIYAIGGARGMTTLFSAVEVYDPATDSWMREADMPTARCLHSTSAVDGNIYSIGGSVICWPWTPTATVEAYNTGFIPLQEFSSVRPKAKLPTNWGQIRSD